MDLPFLLNEGTELNTEMHLRMFAGGLWEGTRGSDTQKELRASRNHSTLKAVSMTSPTCPATRLSHNLTFIFQLCPLQSSFLHSEKPNLHDPASISYTPLITPFSAANPKLCGG